MEGVDGVFASNEDPAAEFLAREQSELAELGIDDQIGVQMPATDFPDAVQQQSPEPVMSGFTEDIGSSFTQATAVGSVQQQEPDSLRKWREEKSDLLEQMEKDENDEQQRWTEKANKELEDWYSRYNEQLKKVQNENRAAQEEFIEDMAGTTQGNDWVKVARLCDFNPKVSKNTKDISRMRSILLRLKQEPLVR